MVKTKTDAKGQLELDGIDTPLGVAADNLIQTKARLRGAKDSYADAETRLIEEMRAAKVSTLNFKGDNLTLKSGTKTKDCIQFK